VEDIAVARGAFAEALLSIQANPVASRSNLSLVIAIAH
jgi:hypothetical protein